jgi:hypothetical protein
LAAVGLALVLARPAPADWLNFGRHEPWTQSQQVVTPVATNIPIGGAQPGPLSSRLTSLMPSWIPIRTNTSGAGQTKWPTYKDMPGLDYLKAFHYGRGVPIVP